MKTKVKRIKKEKVEPFNLSVLLEEKKYSIVGNSFLDCIEKFIITLAIKKIFKGKCIINANHNERTADLMLWPHLVKRLYLNKIYQQIIAKRILLALK